MLLILGTMHHIIVIYGAHVQHNISRRFVYFFKILTLQIVSGVKGQNMTQNDKKLYLLHFMYITYLRSHTLYHCHLWYTCVK